MSIAFAFFAESPARSVCIQVSFALHRSFKRLSVGQRASTGRPMATVFAFRVPRKHRVPNA